MADYPDTNGPTYSDFLVSHNFPSAANTFDNTRVGIMDSGFDNGQISYSAIHPDFRFTFDTQQITVVDGQRTLWTAIGNEDRDHHGTLVTSIVAGFPSATSGRTENRRTTDTGWAWPPPFAASSIKYSTAERCLRIPLSRWTPR